jgi:hypothetical protein
MTGPQNTDAPPVAEWIRGKAIEHRRAGKTCLRTGHPEQAEAYRLAAIALTDVARATDEYLADRS